MTKSKIFKFIFICLFIFVTLMNYTKSVEASSYEFSETVVSTQKLAKSDKWKPDWNQFDNQKGGKTDKVATKIVGALINIVAVIGAGVAIIMLIILGVQYVTSNVSGKAEIKKSATKYVFGAILIFAATGILKIVQIFIDANINDI